MLYRPRPGRHQSRSQRDDVTCDASGDAGCRTPMPTSTECHDPSRAGTVMAPSCHGPMMMATPCLGLELEPYLLELLTVPRLPTRSGSESGRWRPGPRPRPPRPHLSCLIAAFFLDESPHCHRAEFSVRPSRSRFGVESFSVSVTVSQAGLPGPPVPSSRRSRADGLRRTRPGTATERLVTPNLTPVPRSDLDESVALMVSQVCA
jgi:hypothetical protein